MRDPAGPFPSDRSPTWVIVAEIEDPAARKRLRASTTPALFERAIAVAKATRSPCIGVAMSANGGSFVTPLADLAQVIDFQRVWIDAASQLGAVRIAPIGLDQPTLTALRDDFLMLTGAELGSAGHA